MGEQEQRDKEIRIRRLRKRLDTAEAMTPRALAAILKGILDLLADEL